MLEILPGVHHWTAMRESIGLLVSSYYVDPAGILIDPMLPEEGLDAFAGLQRPQQVVLTSGLHARDAGAFADAFGCVIRAPRAAAARLQGTLDTQPYSHGDELAPAVTSLEIGRLAPDEYALHLQITEGAIVFADALNHYGDTLGFFPDYLLGDDPPAVKRALTRAFEGLLAEREFDHLLFAHGDPIVGGGKAALRTFINQQFPGSADA
jgi:hypothetical protein